MNKIVIIGGGTAGWLTAIFARKVFSEDVTVVSSSLIDILGAGEGSTPNLLGMLKNFEIDIEDFIKKTHATKKSGVTFINWGEKESAFSHLFNLNGDQKYGLHFNARKTAEYLENYSKDLGIKKVDARIEEFKSDSDGNIISVICEEGISINCDFLFDCSGFQRLVTGKHFNSEWISYSDKLICNKAFAFFLPQEEEINENSVTETNAVAMKSGWMWKIPLQNRMGCGYAYSDKHITLEDAKKEVEEYLGKDIKIEKAFQFNPGSFRRTWINNTISLGLSSGFIEPLEATSIMGLIISMEKLITLKIFEGNEYTREEYNKFVSSNNEQIVTFLMHHYNCGRKDTEFWRDVDKIELPDVLKFVRSGNTFDPPTIKKMFKLERGDLIFGEKNYRVVDYGHRAKKKEKSFL